MCKCTPSIRTPFCGKGDCQWPEPEGEWAPWKDFAKELERLPIDEPPCKRCIYFNPRRRYVEGHYDGVEICTVREMNHDFSCFSPMEVRAKR